MSVGWRGAPPPALAPAGLAGRLRIALRAPVAALWLALMVGAFLLVRGLDRARRAITLRDGAALAPFVVQAWALGALRILGLRLDRRGTPMRHPGVIVANHASWLDIVVLMRATRVFFVSKAEVEGWPAIGWIARTIGTIFIERRPAEARRQTEALRRRLRRGDRLCLFPEGTSTDGRRVLPFKSALFAVLYDPELAGALWVQPVSLVYRPPAGQPPEFYAWWGDMDFGAHLLAVLARPGGGRVEVIFHPPLRPAASPDRKALAEAAAAAVRAGHGSGRAA